MATMTESELFNVFQPICVELTKEITLENLTTLKRALYFVNKSSPFPEPLQEYLLFPLRIIFKASKTNSSQDILQATTECITSILEKAPLTKWETLKDLLVNFLIKLCNPKNFNEVADLSEEFKISILKCIETIIEKSDYNAVQHVYSEEFLPQLAHLIVLILEISRNEQARAVRITALNILTTLTFCKKKESLVDSRAISASFASFIPKISTSLAKVILGDSVQGHGVTVAAMEAFTNVVLVSMNDGVITEALENIKKSGAVEEPNKKNRPIAVQRTETWLNETAFNLNLLIERLAELVSHSHWRVTLSLAELAGTLLSNCFNSLSKSIGKLLDILLTLAAHDTKPVAKKSHDHLKCVMKKFSSTECFIECLEDNLYELVSKLPRIIRNSDETKTLALLNLLASYIQLLGPRVDSLLLSNTHMRHLSLSLLQLAQMECTDVNIVALKTSSADFSGKFDSENDEQYNPLKKAFKHFSSKKSYEEFVKICYLLGNYGTIENQIDYFLEVFTSSPIYRKESVLIMNELLSGAAGILLSERISGNLLDFLTTDIQKNHSAPDRTKLIKIVNTLLEEYLQPNIWMLPVTCVETSVTKSTDFPDLLVINSKDKNATSVENLGSNIYLICLMLESIGNFSRVLEVDFIVSLRKILYPLLDKMSSDSALVSHTAFHTATVIALHTGNSNVAQLIHNNADYLVDSLSLRLHHILENPSAPHILRVAVQNSGPDILPLLKDSVDELLNGLDHHHGQQAELFMEAINALVTGVHLWFSTTSFKKTDVPLTEANTVSVNEIENDSNAGIKLKDFFINFHNLKNIAEAHLGEDYANDLDSQDDNNNNNNNNNNNSSNIEDFKEDEEEKKTPPYYVNMLVEILERCVHVMSSTRFTVSLSILDTINRGILALEPWEDQLLPIVHKLWQPLIGRFSDRNLVIVKKAFSVICTMASICGDFVSKRMLEDVWPKLMSFLESQFKISSSVDTKSYSFTSAYKLQVEMLTRIANLSSQLSVPLESCDGLIRICFLYLNSNQPQSLQEAALESLRGLSIVNADAVWLHLSSYIEDDSTLPHPCFTRPKMLKPKKEGKEIHENAKKILIEKLHWSLASGKNF